MWMAASWNKNKKAWNLILEAQGTGAAVGKQTKEAHDIVWTDFEKGSRGVQPDWREAARGPSRVCYTFYL